MTQLFNDQVVVVAGAGRGLGREVAEVALREGARVALGARSANVLAELASQLDPSGERVIAERLDVVDRVSCASFIASTTKRFGQLDALVNVAAYDDVLGGIDDPDWDKWRRALEVNVLGAMYLVDAAAPKMAGRGGAVVFVGSQSAFFALHDMVNAGYGASKAALVGAMRHLAVELGPKGIRVNTVAPGWMWGPAVEGYVRATAQEVGVSERDVIARINHTLPLRYMASDGDVAETIMFLASDRARAITGQTLLVNAGELMQ